VQYLFFKQALGPTYDYQYTSHFYDPDYDFSTYAKFYSIPGVGPLDFMENIEYHIALKRDCPDDYYREVIKVVDDNNMVSQIMRFRNDGFKKRSRDSRYGILQKI
jgi:hypothetical protein